MFIRTVRFILDLGLLEAKLPTTLISIFMT
jgi:hypothetical protein